jgi:LysM repeat protein
MSEQTRCIRYNIKRHETLSDVMRRFDISLTDLMEYNEACNLLSLSEGQTLLIKSRPRADRSYVLGEGETLWTVAEKLGVSVPSLLKANSNFMPNEIRQGISIALPDSQL